MFRPLTSAALVQFLTIMLCVSATLVHAAPPRGAGGGSAGRGASGGAAGARGGSAPGGNWSTQTHRGGQAPGGHASEGPGAGNAGAFGAAGNHEGADGAAAANRRGAQGSGTNDAAAGAAFANRRGPQATSGEDAAAGAAAANRRGPQSSGAEDAAAGAAAASRRGPQASGAADAAAGAAVANRNQPQYSGAEGAAAGAAVADRNQPQYSGAAGYAAGTAAVRNSYTNPVLYGDQWYGAHPEVWAPRGLTAASAWAPTSWTAVSGHLGAAAAPVAYNYGDNVTYADGQIAVDGQNVGTAAEFSQQAADLAQAGAAAQISEDDQWLPLGIFAMVRNEQQHPQLIMQLAVNKQGVIRGNFTDEVSESTQPVQGSVDPKTQRAAWTVGTNQTSIMEAGISNLAQGVAPALIHKNGQTDHWLLVRLDQPNSGTGSAMP